MLLGILAALLIPLQHASVAEAASVLQRLLLSRSLLQAPASDVPFVARFDTLLTQLGPGRPVTLKNVEAARLLSFAQAGAQASPGADGLCWRFRQWHHCILVAVCEYAYLHRGSCTCTAPYTGFVTMHKDSPCLQHPQEVVNWHHCPFCPLMRGLNTISACANAEPSVLVQLATGPVLVAWQNASAAAVIAFAVCGSAVAHSAIRMH